MPIFFPPVKPYIGQVATGCRVPQNINASTATQMMSRSRHRMVGACSTIRVGLPAFWAGNNSGFYIETAPGGDISYQTITAALEYPAGTFTQLTFEGSSTGYPIGLNTLFSDSVTAPPQGAFFFIRAYRVLAVYGVPYTYWANGVDVSNGESCAFGLSGITDQTLGGTITNTLNGVMYSPIAIIGSTTQPSIAIVGDSRAFGASDTFSGTSGAVGNIERSVSPYYALINGGVIGDRGDRFLYSCAGRLAALRFCSHLICQYGINDIVTGSDSSATVKANLQNIWGLWPRPDRVFQCTYEPYTTSTDSWATTGNQSVTAQESVRTAVNDWIRTRPSGIQNYFEIADQVETSRNSGKWDVNGSASWYTNDGVHGTNTANLAIAASGCISPGMFGLGF